MSEFPDLNSDSTAKIVLDTKSISEQYSATRSGYHMERAYSGIMENQIMKQVKPWEENGWLVPVKKTAKIICNRNRFT